MARRKKKRYVSSSSEESESSDSSGSSSSEVSSDSESGSSGSSDSESDSSNSSQFEDDEDMLYDEDPEKTVEDIREIIRDQKLMKFERAIIEDAEIDSLERMRDCTDKTLKKTGMDFSERERLRKAFGQHLDEKQSRKPKKSKKKSKRSQKQKTKKSKKSKKSKAKPRRKKNAKKKGKSKKSKAKSRKSKDDDDDPLSRIDTTWSGKKQAWKDFKDHEARVAELVEFYEEIGRKRSNGEEHARKLLLSYPGGIDKLVIALDKKYHHIPYGWEDILEEAKRKEELEEEESDSSG